MTRSSRLISETKWFRFLSGKFLEILVWRTTEHKYSIWLMDRGAQALHLVDGPWNTSMAFCWRTVEHKYGILLTDSGTQIWHFVDGQWNTNMAFCWALLSPLSPSTDSLLGFHVYVPINFCFQNWLRWLLVTLWGNKK